MQLGAGGHFGFMQIAQQLQNCIKRICVLHSFAEHNQEKTGVHPLMQGYLQLLPDHYLLAFVVVFTVSLKKLPCICAIRAFSKLKSKALLSYFKTLRR